MMALQFHETAMGRKFFESTLPRLCSALERIFKELQQEKVHQAVTTCVRDSDGELHFEPPDGAGWRISHVSPHTDNTGDLACDLVYWERHDHYGKYSKKETRAEKRARKIAKGLVDVGDKTPA